MFAEIILNKTAKELNKVFDYIIPNEMKKILKLGDRVLVPFGKGSKLVDGIVTNIKSESKFANKEIVEIKNSYLTKENIEFAKLMARRYFCNDFDCIKLMLPPGTVSKEVDNWVKEKQEKFVYLIKTEKEIREDIENKKIKSEKHIELLEYLINLQSKINNLKTDNNNKYYETSNNNTSEIDVNSKSEVNNEKFNNENKNTVSSNSITLKIEISILEKELNISKAVIKTVEKNGYIEIRAETIKRNPFKEKKVERDKEFILNEEQQYAYFRVNDCIEKNVFQEFLLYGVTGSRKNRSIFTINKKRIRKRENSNIISTRNFSYATNSKQIYSKIW